MKSHRCLGCSLVVAAALLAGASSHGHETLKPIEAIPHVILHDDNHAESILPDHDRAPLRVQGNRVHPVGRFEHKAFKDLSVEQVAKTIDPLFKQDQTGVLIPRLQ